MLRAVSGVDVNVIRCEIAGPDARSAAAGAQVHHALERSSSSSVDEPSLAERMLHAVPAGQNSAHVNFGLRRDRTLLRRVPPRPGCGPSWGPRRRTLSSPVAILRWCAPPAPRRIARRAAHFDFDHVARAFAIAHDLQRQRVAHFFERREIADSRRLRRIVRFPGLAAGQQTTPYRWSRYRRPR